ncbi:MAG: DUF4365 domain-containing protein [Anaerolineaceae bacterium]|nr:DUF4365 domain-containing protein [Anaerolineaceae bacterium]
MQRYTSQQQIEDISRAQLDEVFFQLGWIPNPIKRDVGEDIIVGIYDSGRWSGLSFFVQLKGTNSFETYKLKTEPYISYPIDTSDLIHWQNAVLPIVFIVWDIGRRSGIWDTITNIIDRLNQVNPQWTNKKTVQVRLKLSSMLDNVDEARNLRRSIADQVYSAIAHKKSLDIDLNLNIPNSPQGKDFFSQFEDFRARGGQITIPPEFIADVSVSDWHQQLYGEAVFSKDHPWFIESRESDISIPTRMDIISPEGKSASLPYIDLKVIWNGPEQGIVSNRHQEIPIHIEIMLNWKTRELAISLTLVGPGLNVQDTLDALRFSQIFHTPSSKLYLMPLTAQKPLMLQSPIDKLQNGIDEEFINLVEKLCLIQNKTGVRLVLPELVLDSDTARRINEIHSIVSTGSLQMSNTEATPELTKHTITTALKAIETGQAVSYSTIGSESSIEILGTDIPLGEGNWNITMLPRVNATELQSILDDMEADDTKAIPVHILTGSAEFPKWKSE